MQKNKTKTSEKTLKKQICNLPDKEFKVMVLKILTEFGRRMDEYSEKFNKTTENTCKYQTEVTELKNTITQLKKKTTREVQTQNG